MMLHGNLVHIFSPTLTARLDAFALSSNPFGRYQSPDQIYNKRLRSWLNIGLFLCFIIASIVIVGLAIWTVIILLKHEKRPFVIAAIVSLVPFAVVLTMVGFNNLPTCLLVYLKHKIKSKIERRHLADLSNTWFVGIAPGQSLTIFGGDSCLDVGFLSIEPGRLLFYGDIVEFELKDVQVKNVAIQAGLFYGLKFSRVIISWTHSTVDGVQDLAIEMDDCCRIFGKSRKTLKLFSCLSDWHKEAAASSSSRQFELPPYEDEFTGLAKMPMVTFGPSCLLNIISGLATVNAINIITDFRKIWFRPYGKFIVVVSLAVVICIYYVVYKQYKRPLQEDHRQL